MSGEIYTMVGNSMNPTLFEPMILEITRPDRYCPGDVVVFSDRNKTRTTVHRIVKCTPSGFITRGDNNLTEDQPIIQEDILGKVVAAYRGEKRFKIRNGKYGYREHRYLQTRKRLFPYFIKMFTFWYHLLSGSGICIHLLPKKFKPRIIQYQNRQAHLFIGSLMVGRYDVHRRHWIIFRPWRIFIDEKTLPLTNP